MARGSVGTRVMRRDHIAGRLLAGALVAAVAGCVVPVAEAGAPKAQRLVRVEIARSGAVMAVIGGPSGAVRLRLAGLRSRSVLKAGRPCVVQPTDFAIGQIANSGGFANATAIVPSGDEGATSAYLAPRGKRFRVKSSLNWKIAAAGLARVTRTRSGRPLLPAQASARNHRVGVWGHCRQARSTHKRPSPSRRVAAPEPWAAARGFVERALELLDDAARSTVRAPGQ